MTLELDAETLAQLGWGTCADREDGLRINHGVTPASAFGAAKPMAQPKPVEFDGRHKSRNRVALSVAYWARRKAS